MSNEPKEHSSGFMAQDRTKVDLIYRQAAIDVMLMAIDDDWEPDYAKDRMCELPSAQPEPPTHGSISAKTVQKQCNRTIDDCISRQAAIDFIAAGHLCNPNEPRWSDNEVVNFLKSRPSAQPERRYDEWCTDCKEYDHERHCCPRWNRVIRTTLQDAQRTGRWIYYPEINALSCSECKHYVYHYEPYKYCPNCGARMEEEDGNQS